MPRMIRSSRKARLLVSSLVVVSLGLCKQRPTKLADEEMPASERTPKRPSPKASPAPSDSQEPSEELVSRDPLGRYQPPMRSRFEIQDQATSKFPHPTRQGEGYVYVTRSSKTKHTKVWDFASYFIPNGYAVAGGDHGWALLNPSLKVIGYTFGFDNAPDPVQEGFVRLKSKGRIRYFSVETGALLDGDWDAGTPFHQGIACVCNNCVHPDGEHRTIKGGGQGWVIDNKGRILQTWPKMMGGFPGKCPLKPGVDAKEWNMLY